VIYRVDVPKRARVSARINRQEGDHVFVMMKTCGDKSTEIACGERVDELLAAGTYYLAVDGKGTEGFGKVSFDFRVRDVGAQEAACHTAPLLVDGHVVTASTAGAGDKFTTSCGGPEHSQSSPDRLYKLVLNARTHIRLTLLTTSWDGVLAIRKSCLEPPTTNGGTAGARGAEVACNNDAEDARHSRIDTTLEPGTYFVQVDGHASGNEGPFTLEYRILR
jgi:hypothetical protein